MLQQTELHMTGMRVRMDGWVGCTPGEFVYLICEISCTVQPLRWNATTASMEAVGAAAVSTLPHDWVGGVIPEVGELLGCTTADIHCR